MTGAGAGLSGLDQSPHAGAFAAVLIDLDGVLIDSTPGVLALWRDIAADHGVELSPADARRHILGCAPEHTVQALFGDVDAAPRILDRVRAAEPELGFAALPGASALVRNLHQHGVRLALVTGASRARTGRVLRRLGLAARFDAVVTWGDVPRGKPDPDCYLLAASRLGVEPPRCLVLEDAPAGVTAALGAGASCVGVSRHDGGELAARGARPVVTAVSDLDCTRTGRLALTAAGRPIAYLES